MSLNRYDLVAETSQNARSAGKLLYISSAKFGVDWLSVPHTHDCAELFYIVGGKGSFLLGEEVCHVAADDLVVVNPQVQHTETSPADQPLEYIVLGIEGLELAVSEDQSQQFYVGNFQNSTPSMQVYLRDMLREVETKAPGYEAICQDLLDILLIRLMRSSNYAARLVPAAKRASRESTMVRRYIDSHFKENLTLDLLASTIHINKYHMVHSFSRDYGISPINYLLSLRLRESCTLLETTNYSMSQIARIVGFSSSCYFSQVFRKATGVSPSEYRKGIRSHTPPQVLLR